MRRLSPALVSAALVALLAVAGCDAFEPTGEPALTEVDATPRPVDLDLTAPEDTLGLWGTADLMYTLSDPEAVREVRVSLAGRTYTAAPGAPVRIPTAEIADGLYLLVVRAVAGSGTGSLADVYGQETVTVETQRTVVVDNAPPTPVAVRSLAAEGGLLTVRWDRYPRRNFASYQVYRSTGTSGRRLVTTITDRDVTAWADSSVVGGTVRYDVVVVAGDRRTAFGPARERAFPVPAFTEVSARPTGEITLAWDRGPFPAAPARYEVLEGEFASSAEVAVTTEAVTATIRRPSDFGAAYSLRLRTRTDSQIATSPVVRTAIDPESGLRGKALPGPDGQSVFGVEAASGQPVLLDPKTAAVRVRGSVPGDLRGGAVVASAGGRLAAIYLQGGQWVAALLDPGTLAVERAVPLAPFIGASEAPDLGNTQASSGHGPVLTDAGVLFVGIDPARAFDYEGPTAVGVDLQRSTLAASFGEDSGTPRAPYVETVTGDGRFLVLGFDGLYERDDAAASGYRLVDGFRQTGGVRAAVAIGSSRLAVLGQGGGVRVVSLPSLREEASVPLPSFNEALLSYDPASGRVLVATDSRAPSSLAGYSVYAFAPRTGAAVTTVPTAFFPSRVSLAGGTLWGGEFFGTGVYRPLF